MAAAFDAYLIMIKGFEDAYDNLQNMDMEEFREIYSYFRMLSQSMSVASREL